jgi:2-oxo-4-hydroxy-4-carboxy--5-ureidoimidazoline (OHCU) decarboxylase
VYATGKTADEMLAIARERLDNVRAAEIANAAGEQRKITATRLGRMLCQEAK